MVVLVVRHREMPESPECRRNFLVCISEMKKRVLGARLWCSLSPDHAFLGLCSLLRACQSDWKSSVRQHRSARALLLAGKLLQRAQSSAVIVFQLPFCCHFLEKSPWKCPTSLPHSSSPLPTAPRPHQASSASGPHPLG